MQESTENWKKVYGWPYEVSSLGRVRRSEPGQSVRIGHIMAQQKKRSGYIQVAVRRTTETGREQRYLIVHRAVLEAFVGVCPEGCNANHKDGDKSNNRLSNLEWVSLSRNQLHAIDSGLYGGRGEGHGRAKLTTEQVREIRLRYAGEPGEQGRLAAEFGVSQNLVSKIVRGEIWTHIHPPQAVAVAFARRGDEHGLSKLSPRKVRSIRQRYAAGESDHALAAEYGVGRQVIRNIGMGKTWRHVD